MKLESKKDFCDLLLYLLEPLKEKFSDNYARVDLGDFSAHYDTEASQLEAWGRPLWGLAPLWKCNCEDGGFSKMYVKGLASGTDKKNNEYWGDCHDFDQRFVEMAGICYGLLLAPKILWEPLSDEEKDNVASWLYQINEKQVPKINWLFFNIITNITLKKLGRKYDQTKIDENLKLIDSWYLGNGWYEDGKGGRKDYYIAFAMHFYSLLYAKVMENDDPVNSKKFKERAEIFGKDFIYWFSDNGEAIPYGRSLTYRFAQCAFWSMCVLADVKPYPVSVMKGIIVRNLKYWFQNDDIFDNADILTVGYKYQNLIMSEHYNAPGSPYWALKTFAFLALDENHEFFKVKAEKMPNLDEQKYIKHMEMITQRIDGQVFAYPTPFALGDLGQMIPKYYKFCYSTLFGFNVTFSNYDIQEASPDSMLVFDIDGIIMQNRRIIESKTDNNSIVIKWTPFKGIDVETKITPKPWGHERKHKITSEYDCKAYDCGFALKDEKISATNGDNCIEVRNNFSYCKVEGGKPFLITASPNTNLLHPKTKIPSVIIEIKKGTTEFTTRFTVKDDAI